MRAKRKFQVTTPLMEGARKSEATPTGRVFKGVTLIKSGLGNKRDKNYYPPEALQEGVRVGLFEGLRAFADHPDSVSEEIQPERSVRDLVGVYENAQYDHGTNAVTADLRILRSHSWLSEAIDELIDAGHADKIGLSINGRGETEPTRRRLEESGEEVEVNELKKFIELRSTDVVTEAGAGGGFAQLVESARRAKVVQESAPMKKSIVLANLREAVRTGNFAEAKKLEKAIDTAEDDTQEAAGDEDGDEKPGRKTKEMGAFGAAGKMKGKKRYAMEAADADPDAEDADDDLEEGADEDDEDEVDEDAALDEAAEAEREDADDDLEEADDEDEDEADDEGDDTREADTVPGRAKFRTREAGIIGATGKPTGKVTSGVGKFTKKARSAGGGGRLSTKTTGGFRTKGMPGKHRESAASVALVQQNRRLREHIARQDSVNLATKMLRESSLPRAVRPHVLRSLVGLTRAEMQAEINKQASILEAAASSAVERLSDDFDVVEGAGATTLRESYFGGGSDGDDLGSVLAECGLPMKR